MLFKRGRVCFYEFKMSESELGQQECESSVLFESPSGEFCHMNKENVPTRSCESQT